MAPDVHYTEDSSLHSVCINTGNVEVKTSFLVILVTKKYVYISIYTAVWVLYYLYRPSLIKRENPSHTLTDVCCWMLLRSENRSFGFVSQQHENMQPDFCAALNNPDTGMLHCDLSVCVLSCADSNPHLFRSVGIRGCSHVLFASHGDKTSFIYNNTDRK